MAKLGFGFGQNTTKDDALFASPHHAGHGMHMASHVARGTLDSPRGPGLLQFLLWGTALWEGQCSGSCSPAQLLGHQVL
jgi:hypothetical protein